MKLSFFLQQHTPLIHFQHQQNGATIRPTELKSKLDKFIIGQKTGCFGLENARFAAAVKHTEIQDWLKQRHKPEFPALDYSVRVEIVKYYPEELIKSVEKIERDHKENGELNTTSRGNQIPLSFYCYFGNMDSEGKKEEKQFAFHQLVQVDIQTTHAGLGAYIQEIFPQFLMQTNFGMRQSKGFGSYYLHPSDPHYQTPKGTYYFDVDLSTKVIGSPDKEFFKVREMFRVVDLFYKTLRSGINTPHPDPNRRFYVKSLLWHYLMTKGLQWDKKTIKQQFFANQELQQKQVHATGGGNASPLHWENGKKITINRTKHERTQAVNTHLLWRDLMGLSVLQDWMFYSKDKIKKEHVRDLKDPKFDRMASPLFIKPLRTGPDSFRVLLSIPEHLSLAFREKQVDKAPEAGILGQWFAISSKNTGKNFELPFPDSFDYDAFLKHAFSVNMNSHIQSNLADKRLLVTIFTSLNQQLQHG